MERFNLHAHKILQHFTFEINHRKWRVELLISDVTGNVKYHIPHKKIACLFLSPPTYLLNIMVCTTQIKSHNFISHTQRHFITTSPLTYVTNGIRDFVKCCIKSRVHLDLRPENMLFGALRPSVNDMERHWLCFSCTEKPFPWRCTLWACWTTWSG